jgi:hypothetical protein
MASAMTSRGTSSRGMSPRRLRTASLSSANACHRGLDSDNWALPGRCISGSIFLASDWTGVQYRETRWGPQTATVHSASRQPPRSRVKEVGAISGALTLDELPPLQTPGVLTNGSFFDIRPASRKQFCKLFMRALTDCAEKSDESH